MELMLDGAFECLVVNRRGSSLGLNHACMFCCLCRSEPQRPLVAHFLAEAAYFKYPGRYPCDCGVTFKSIHHLNSHLRRHTDHALVEADTRHPGCPRDDDEEALLLTDEELAYPAGYLCITYVE